MFYFNTLNLNQISGGNQVKQGDFGSTFTYKLADEKNQELDIFDQKTAYVNLVLDNNIVFTTTVIVNGSTVTFNIDKAIPTGLYFLEIKIDSYIFPSDRRTIILVTAGSVAYDLKDLVPNYDTNTTISGILSDLSQKGIDISDLGSRLDETNAQLAQKPNKDDVRENTNTRPINISEMDTETKQLFTGGAVAVVGENAVGRENIKPQAVTVNHLEFSVSTDNKFDGVYIKDVALAASPSPGSLVNSSGGRTAIIPISSNRRYYVEKFDASNRFRVYLSSSDTRPVAGDTMTKMVNVLNTKKFIEVIPDADSRFLVITTSTSNETPRLNVTESNIAGGFIPYRVVEKRYIENQRVDVSDLADNVAQAITTKNTLLIIGVRIQ